MLLQQVYNYIQFVYYETCLSMVVNQNAGGGGGGGGVRLCGQGGEGSIMAEKLRTSFMDGPLNVRN